MVVLWNDKTSENRLLHLNMDSKCVVMNLNKDNCGLKGSDKKLIYFGEFWSRITSGAARGGSSCGRTLLTAASEEA